MSLDHLFQRLARNHLGSTPSVQHTSSFRGEIHLDGFAGVPLSLRHILLFLTAGTARNNGGRWWQV